MTTDKPECTHENRGYCWRTFSNGTRHFGTQCLRCGDWRALSQKGIKAFDLDAGEYDDDIKKAWEKHRAEYWESIRTERLLTFEQGKQDFKDRLSEYYSSPEWHSKRHHRLTLNQTLFGGLCEICFINKARHVHHMTYARVGSEWIFDLAAICPDCHASIHPDMDI